MKAQLSMLLLLAFAGAAQAQGGLTKNIPGSSGGGSGDEAPVPELADANHKIYFGADYADTTLSVSDSGLGAIGTGKYTSKFVDIRAGYRFFNAIGVEVHGGVPTESASRDGGRLQQSQYFAGFVVPTATVFSAFELAFPVGYAHTKLKRQVNGARDSANLDSVAFGVNIEVPIRVFASALPDLRITGGGMVYSQKSNARYYGFHYGLRYDFGL
ncbi:MAG: hypothetical protein NVS9B10_22860 [Nevskia sp.]